LPDIPSDTSLPVENIMSEKLPHLLELGSSSCVPCLMMRPILAELTTEYKGQMVVKFIDVYENPDIARKYNIRGIPTQIFLNSEGKEISRHIGFISKDEILEQWKRLGFSFTPVSTKKENR
ncbi:MAG: thioredoxin family protein, partial [Bacteroidales bacterium]